jgi:hypothetical protein
VFRVVPSPIIRNANNCIYRIWYFSHCYCYLSNPFQHFHDSDTVWQIPDAVDTVVCDPDEGWCYHPKYIEQFSDKINCVTLHLVGYVLEYDYHARTHERQNVQMLQYLDVCTHRIYMPMIVWQQSRQTSLLILFSNILDTCIVTVGYGWNCNILCKIRQTF